MKIVKLTVGQMETNCYLVANILTNEVIIIDPGEDADLITETILKEGWKPMGMLATHGHFDHVMAAFELQLNFDIPFYIHNKDEFLIKRMTETAKHFLGEAAMALPPQKIEFFDFKTELWLMNNDLQIVATPGHTPGSVSFCSSHDRVVFCGDLIFAEGGRGRTDFNYSSDKDLFTSMEKILKLPDETILYSGHGEETTVGQEREFWVGSR